MSILSNQSVGFKKGTITKEYAFTKEEFNRELVPPYAYDIQDLGDTICFKCTFDALGDPVFKSHSERL